MDPTLQATIDAAVQAALQRLNLAGQGRQDVMVEEYGEEEDSEQGELGHRAPPQPWSSVLDTVTQQPVTLTGLDLTSKLQVPPRYPR